VLGVTCKIVGDAPDIILPYYLKAGNLFVEGFVDAQKCMFLAISGHQRCRYDYFGLILTPSCFSLFVDKLIPHPS
jgi:hypothetical protein